MSVGYSAEQQRLEVEFRGGRVYEYLDVPPSVHAWLMRVPNKSGFINRMLSPAYRFRALAPEHTCGDLEAALRRSLAALED